MEKYFLYSREQHKKRTELEKRIGRKYVPGIIIVNGEERQYTEVNTKYNNKFKDTIIVYQGDDKNVKIIKPKVINLRGQR